MRQVVILEPNTLVREGLARLLSERGYTVADGSRFDDTEGTPAPDDAVDLVLTELPDAYNRPSGELSDWLQRVHLAFPRARIILLTDGPARPEVVKTALAGGAHGYVNKDISFAAMLAIIETVMHGQIVYPPVMRDQLLGLKPAAPGEETALEARLPETSGHPSAVAEPRPAGPLPAAPVAPDRLQEAGLSRRESQILLHLAEGHANKIIAHRMSISEATVKSHLKSLLRKLHFSNRTQAAVWAVNRYRNGGMPSGDARL
jgi:two-component system nitrate/nitrite response regulator NarL